MLYKLFILNHVYFNISQKLNFQVLDPNKPILFQIKFKKFPKLFLINKIYHLILDFRFIDIP
jgi:hypothetical protein